MRFFWISVALLLLTVLLAPWFSPEPRLPVSFTVKGQVINGKTNQPVAKARVIVRLNRAGWLTSERFHYGVETDDDGRFEVVVDPPFELRNVEIDAIAPTGEFGSTTYANQPATIELGSVQALDYINYEHFRGEHLGGFTPGKIVFPGASWEIRTDEQIEIGDPNPVIKRVDELEDQ